MNCVCVNVNEGNMPDMCVLMLSQTYSSASLDYSLACGGGAAAAAAAENETENVGKIEQGK